MSSLVVFLGVQAVWFKNMVYKEFLTHHFQNKELLPLE
jgi:hypothetical protein